MSNGMLLVRARLQLQRLHCGDFGLHLARKVGQITCVPSRRARARLRGGEFGGSAQRSRADLRAALGAMDVASWALARSKKRTRRHNGGSLAVDVGVRRTVSGVQAKTGRRISGGCE